MAESLGVVNYTSKWQIALAVGVPVVVGIGYWYFIKKDGKAVLAGKSDKDDNCREISKASDTSDKVKSKKKEERTLLEEATILKEEGNKCFKNGKYEEAIKFYEKAIEMCPKSEPVNLAIFYQNKAAAHEKLEHYEEVKKSCSEALQLNPKYAKALVRRAKAHEETKDLMQALEDLTAACIIENYQSRQTLLSADRLLQELGRQNAKEAIANRIPQTPSTYFIKTYFSSFANDPISSFLTKTEGDFSKGFLKAVDCMKKKDYESIIEACTEEINLPESPYRSEALLLRGTFHKLTGDGTSALSDLDAVIDNEKLDVKLRVNALIKRASIHIQLENQAACFTDFQQAINLDSRNADIYHHRGQINLFMDKIQEAAEDFALASELNPGNPLPVVQKCYTDYKCASILRDEAKLRATLENFEKNLVEYPDCSECYCLYAQVLIDRQEFDKADSLYQRARKIDPKNATIFVNWAFSRLHSNADVDSAVKFLKKALELDDKCVVGYETLGTIEVQRGNLKNAIEMFEKAINVAKTEYEISHLFSLKNAATAQMNVLEKMNA